MVTCVFWLRVLFSLFVLALRAHGASVASDVFTRDRNITDGDTLVSAGGSFTLGFFSPGASTKRYLGIWFSVSEDVVCWVANRDHPLDDTSGLLSITEAGNLLLLNVGSGQVAWSSNSTGATAAATARLRESGNLVVTSGDQGSSSSVILWQSFDHPSNTLLPGMKIGKNLWTGSRWSLSSWRSSNDPAPGRYRYTTETTGVPENVLWDGDVERYRTGPWNGLQFSGIPEMTTYSDMFAYVLTTSPGEVTYGYTGKPGAPLSRVLLTDAGVVQRLVWDAATRAWHTFFQGPRDVCDAYGKCGAFGVCDAGAAATSFCGCARGFGPASLSEWRMRETSSGCRRNTSLECAALGNGTTTTTTDGFVVVRGVKLPDTSNASVEADVATLEECGKRCLANCSCVAYAPADIRGDRDGSGCIMWRKGLVDLRYVDGGQDLYLRSAKSELEQVKKPHRPFPTALVVGASVASVVVVLLIIILLVLRVVRRRHRPRIRILAARSIQPAPAPTVPCVDLSSIKDATGNFSQNNVIGRGGFSVVYEGHLQDGKKVAVKRLIPPFLADKSGEAFMREVEVMSKLRHGNLLQLLSYCLERDERILVYEHMQNNSLNLYIFGEDPRLRSLLNWEQRLEIIRGVAKGVAYLHEGLFEEVIHRDLKPSNILLDDNWRPKIADFGTAKLFVDDQTDPTLVQSAGYTAPEYAMQGYLTLKCDVYSFGVVILEIMSGQRNRVTPTLLSDAWESWNCHKIKDILDSAVAQPTPDLLSKLRRFLQIGLLCVQQSPDDRPSMSSVVTMLNGSGSDMLLPKRPVPESRPRPLLCEDANLSTEEMSGTRSFTIDLT